MTIGEYVDQLMTQFGNLVYTDDNKISEQMLEAEFPKWKQMAILMIYNGSSGQKGVIPKIKANQFINAENYVKTKISYDKNIQDAGADYVVFELEPAVQIDDKMNGFAFVGDKLTGKPFIQLKNPQEWYIAKTSGNTSINEVYFDVTGQGDKAMLKAYGNLQIKEMFLDYIPVDVMNVDIWDTKTMTYRLFDPETDPYPISKDVWDVIKSLAVWEFTPSNQRPADYTNDAKSSLEKQAGT